MELDPIFRPTGEITKSYFWDHFRNTQGQPRLSVAKYCRLLHGSLQFSIIC